MQQSSQFEIPLRVIGPDGSVLWQGSGWLGVVRTAICKAVAITQSDGLAADPGTFIIQADNLAATATPVSNLLTARPMITTGSFDRALLGVALNAAAIGEQVVIASQGSIVTVRVAGATGTLGHLAAPTTTAGLAVSSAAGNTAPSKNLGLVMKPSGAAGGATDTGVATRMGVLVDVGAATI